MERPGVYTVIKAADQVVCVPLAQVCQIKREQGCFFSNSITPDHVGRVNKKALSQAESAQPKSNRMKSS